MFDMLTLHSQVVFGFRIQPVFQVTNQPKIQGFLEIITEQNHQI